MLGERYIFEIIGHRGCEGIAEENSIDAMKKAIDLGIARVEFDLIRLRNGKIVLFHDPYISSPIDKIIVEELTYEQLLLRTGKSKDDIPTLEIILEICKKKIKIQAELKSDGIEAEVASTISRISFPIDDVSVSSFKFYHLMEMRRLMPDLLLTSSCTCTVVRRSYNQPQTP